MFTFVIITYNHRSFILMHLESIKYQIEHYANGKKICLVISDDNSNDGTITIAKEWIIRNKDLFCSVEILKNEENLGTCKNFIQAMRHIRTKYYNVLAGDDLYSPYDFFQTARMLEKNDIVSAPCVRFHEEKTKEQCVDLCYDHYKTNISIGLCPPFMRRALSLAGCFLEAAPTVIRRDWINDEMLSFVTKFKLIEDQPMMYWILKCHPNARVWYDSIPTVLYRVHSLSISHTNDLTIRYKANEDLNQLVEHYAANERNPFFRYIIWLRKICLKGHPLVQFVFPTNHYLVIKQKLFGKRIKCMFTEAIANNADEIRAYLKHISALARQAGIDCSGGLTV